MLTELQTKYVELEKKKQGYKEFLEELKQITEQLQAEIGTGGHFQDGEGTVYQVQDHKGRFVHFHILQSLYSQIPTSLLNIGFVAWIIRMIVNDNFHFSDFFLGYLLLTATVNLTYIVFSIIAAVKARKGQMYYFMVIGELAFKQAYKMTKNTETKNPENKAPKSLTEIH